MISASNVSQKAKKLIQQKLKSLEKQHNVKIILAVESGSRAWGFPSINSDYDVRFIYVRRKEDYLSIKQQRDVIEVDILDSDELGTPLDLNGWDIRKALQLAMQSNAALSEWLQSPIKYVIDNSIVEDLEKIVQKAVNIDYLKMHYFKLANNIWEQIKKNDFEVKLKLYCYALRPTLALKWLKHFGTIPPMDIFSLFQGLISCIDPELKKKVDELIALKENAKEKDVILRNQKIDFFIELLLVEPVNEFKKITDNEIISEADMFFRSVVNKGDL